MGLIEEKLGETTGKWESGSRHRLVQNLPQCLLFIAPALQLIAWLILLTSLNVLETSVYYLEISNNHDQLLHLVLCHFGQQDLLLSHQTCVSQPLMVQLFPSTRTEKRPDGLMAWWWAFPEQLSPILSSYSALTQ